MRRYWRRLLVARAGRFFPSRAVTGTGTKQIHAWLSLKPETPDSHPETFFDTDFLRKLERLHLIAKRLSWAGAKGEHAVSRKGFSLEFSDYRRYQPATICATSIGIFIAASTGCCSKCSPPKRS